MSQIEITTALLADLRQKAEAATIEYDWKLHDDQKNWPVIEFGNRPGEDCGGFTIKGNYSPKLIQDAEFIAAASPAVVLALVDESKRLKERYDEQKLLSTRMIEHAAEQRKEIERLRDRLEELECPNCGNQPKFCMCEVVPLSGSEIDFVTKGVNNADQA
jgi:hypothetical protein